MEFLLLTLLLAVPLGAVAAPGDDPRALACDTAAIAAITRHRTGAMPANVQGLDEAGKRVSELAHGSPVAEEAHAGVDGAAGAELSRLEGVTHVDAHRSERAIEDAARFSALSRDDIRSSKRLDAILREPSAAPAIASQRDLRELLTAEERRKIGSYATHDFVAMNKALRSGEACADCDTISKALEKLPPYEGTVYRGTRISDARIRSQFLTVGAEVSDMGFLSTTFDSTKSNWRSSADTAVTMVIRSKTGRAVESAAFFDSEHEVLFRPGTKFRVSEVLHSGSTPVVFLEEIDPATEKAAAALHMPLEIPREPVVEAEKVASEAPIAKMAELPPEEFSAVRKALDALPEMHSFKSDDGTNLVYSVIPGKPGGRPIVISEGKGVSVYRYLEFAKELGDRGYGPIFILDHRGQGFSEQAVKDAVYVKSFKEYTKDFIKFMDGPVKNELAARGIEAKPAIVAHSMGGAVANLALRERPDLTDSVAYISPMFQIKMGPLMERYNNKPAEYITGGLRYLGLGAHRFGDLDKPGASSGLRLLDYAYAQERAMNVRTAQQTYAWANEAFKAGDVVHDYEDAPGIRTLLFQGRRDKIVNNSAITDYACSVAGCTLVEMPGGHALHDEAIEARRMLVDHVDSFLQGKRIAQPEPDARVRYRIVAEPVRTSDGISEGSRFAVFAADSPPTEAQVNAVAAAVKKFKLDEVLLLPAADTGKSPAEQRALASLAYARVPQARLPSPALEAELRGRAFGESVELLAKRNPTRAVTSLSDESALKDASFGELHGDNIRYGLIGKANDANSSLVDDFVHARNLDGKVDRVASDAGIGSASVRAALTRGEKPEGLALGVEQFLRTRRAPAVTRAELAAAAAEKDPTARQRALTALGAKLEASRAALEAGDKPPAATLIANRNAAYDVASKLDALGKTAEASKARDAARLAEAVRLENEPAALEKKTAKARERLPISKMFAEQAARSEIPIRKLNADLGNKFPAEFEGALARKMDGKKLVVLGAGSNLYNGFLSVKYRLSYLMGVKDEAEKGFYLFDPGFLEKDASGALRVKAEARAAHPNAVILTSMEELPEHSVVIGLTPNSVHADNVADLAGNPKVAGLYLEKPIATSEAELARIQKATDATLTPAYFGDHYLHAGGGLLSAMGVPISGKSALEITFDPTGKLANALTRGEPALKKVTAIEGVNFQEGRGLGERPNLRLASKGGGVGPDLQVHLTNVAHAAGFDFAGIDHVEESVYTAGEPGKGEFVPIAKARLTSPDSAADLRVISGKTTGGATFRIESAQFKPKAENTLTLTGDGGRKLKVDFESGLTGLFEKDGTKIGEMRQHGDPYLLTMNDAVSSLVSGEPEAFQLPQQAASVREALQPDSSGANPVRYARITSDQAVSREELAELERTKPAVAAAVLFRDAAADELARARRDYFSGRVSLAELDQVNALYGKHETAVTGKSESARRIGYLRQEAGYLERELKRAEADGDEARATGLRAAHAEVGSRLADETAQRHEALSGGGKIAADARREQIAALTSDEAVAHYATELGGRSSAEIAANPDEAELFRALREREAADAERAAALPKSETFVNASGARVETNYPVPEHVYTWVGNRALHNNTGMPSEAYVWKASKNQPSGAMINWRKFFPKEHGVVFSWKNPIAGMAAVPGWEEYGEAVVRLELKPGTKALHVIDHGVEEFEIPPGLDLKEYQVLFRENERMGIKEWIVLDPHAIQSAVADPKVLEPELRAELKRMNELGDSYPAADLHSSKTFNPAANSESRAFAEKKVEEFLARKRDTIPAALLRDPAQAEFSPPRWTTLAPKPLTTVPVAERAKALNAELARAEPAVAAEAREVAKTTEAAETAGPPVPKAAPTREEIAKRTQQVKMETNSRAPASIDHEHDSKREPETIEAKTERVLAEVPGLKVSKRAELAGALAKAAAHGRDAAADLEHLSRLATSPDTFESYRLAYVHATEALARHPDWSDAWEQGVRQMMKESTLSDEEVDRVVEESTGLKYYQQTARCLK